MLAPGLKRLGLATVSLSDAVNLAAGFDRAHVGQVGSEQHFPVKLVHGVFYPT